MKKTLKKMTCTLLAMVSVFGCATTLTACETAYPKVELVIEFDGETYALDYKLYRNTAPATVAHFLYLAENGYYDGLCVHDYVEADRLYTGEYTVTDATELVRKNYLETIASYENFAKFPHSVWESSDKTNPTYTLKGEFDDNDISVGSGFLNESFGSLSMYYHAPSSSFEKKVYAVNASDENEVIRRDYKYNLTTSAFFISLKTTSPSNNGYCTFATLQEDSRDELEDLQSAISSYVSENYAEEDEEFTESVSKAVFEHDEFLKDYKTTKTFNVPKEPIIIKKVEVKKY